MALLRKVMRKALDTTSETMKVIHLMLVLLSAFLVSRTEKIYVASLVCWPGGQSTAVSLCDGNIMTSLLHNNLFIRLGRLSLATFLTGTRGTASISISYQRATTGYIYCLQLEHNFGLRSYWPFIFISSEAALPTTTPRYCSK